jgi:hypothetical protein
MTEIITKETLFQKEPTETTAATFTQKALKNILEYYQWTKEQKVHDLKEDEFLGWMATLGTMSLGTGNAERIVKEWGLNNKKTENKNGFRKTKHN